MIFACSKGDIYTDVNVDSSTFSAEIHQRGPSRSPFGQGLGRGQDCRCPRRARQTNGAVPLLHPTMAAFFAATLRSAARRGHAATFQLLGKILNLQGWSHFRLTFVEVRFPWNVFRANALVGDSRRWIRRSLP